MPVKAADTEIAYTGDGTSTAFAFPFEVSVASDFGATINGVSTTAYTLSGLGVDTGGTCTFTSPPANGAAVVLYRAAPYDRQLIDYQYGGEFAADTVDFDFDRVVQLIQQLATLTKRTPRVKRGDLSMGLDLIPEAGKLLGWASNELSLVNVTPSTISPSIVVTTAFGEDLITSSNSANGRTVLDALGSNAVAIPSAATLDVSSLGTYFGVTGTTTTTAISAKSTGCLIICRPTSAWPLTHHATDLILPGGKNYVCRGGDILVFHEYGIGQWRLVLWQENSAPCGFHATPSGNQSGVVTGTWTKVLFQTETYDLSGDYTSGATSTFIAPVTGEYDLSAVVGSVTAIADGTASGARFVVNGSTVIGGERRSNGGAHVLTLNPSLTGVRLTAGDAVTVEVLHNHGSNITLDATGGTTTIPMSFSGRLAKRL